MSLLLGEKWRLLGMAIIHRIIVRLAGAVLMLALAGYGPVMTTEAQPAAVSQVLQHSGDAIWGRVPYCSCLVGTATASVAAALKKDNLTTSLKELSPRDGWLYFAVTFDPDTATWDQVSTAIIAGGAQLLDGPP
jgi:hypothetical protein